jgi:hypothetical protein
MPPDSVIVDFRRAGGMTDRERSLKRNRYLEASADAQEQGASAGRPRAVIETDLHGEDSFFESRRAGGMTESGH